MTLEVRLLGPADADEAATVEELVGLVNKAYEVGEAGLWREGARRTSPEEIAEAIRREALLAATLDGRFVGCARLRPLDAHVADLSLISAAPAEWGTGVGRELVRAAERLIWSRGTRTVQLELLVPKGWQHPEKKRLREWYDRLGYRVARSAPVEEVVPHLAPELAVPCEFLIFHKRLTDEACRG